MLRKLLLARALRKDIGFDRIRTFNTCTIVLRFNVETIVGLLAAVLAEDLLAAHGAEARDLGQACFGKRLRETNRRILGHILGDTGSVSDGRGDVMAHDTLGLCLLGVGASAAGEEELVVFFVLLGE